VGTKRARSCWCSAVSPYFGDAAVMHVVVEVVVASVGAEDGIRRGVDLGILCKAGNSIRPGHVTFVC
jgi:hypothetical protein